MEHDVELERALGRLEGKVDSLIEDLQILRQDSIGKMGKIELRLQNVEKKQYGVFLLAGTAFTAILTFVKKFWN